MIKINLHHSLVILISLPLLLGGVLMAQAAPPRSVGLLSFEATALANAVRLDWETATELGTAGFIVKRSVNSGPFISLPDIGVPGFTDAAGNPAGFVIAIGGPAEGGIYQVTDADVQAGHDYTYKLIEVENDNNEIELDMQSVTFTSAPTNTPTALLLVTTASDSTTTATSTLLPGSTVTSVATIIPTATATQAANNGTANAPAAAAPTVVPAGQPATVTESSQGGDQGSSNTTTNTSVLAQVETTATAVPPTPSETTTNGDNGYPGFEVQSGPTEEPATPTPVLLEPAVTAYPLATSSAGQDEATPAVPVIGSRADANEANLSQGIGGRNQRLGRIYLWSGFLLALLIFITTIVATILLFTRKRTQ